MYLGKRSVRSAGRTSGSVEITLPARLQLLVGVDCHLIMRDGPRPEVVLQPDLAVAHELFRDLWERLRIGLSDVDDVGEFAATDFTLTLFMPSHWQERPPLVSANALHVLRTRARHGGDYGEPLAQILASLGYVAAMRLGLKGKLSLAFGDALAYVLTGCSVGLGTDFERGVTRQIYLENLNGLEPLASLFDHATWRRCAPAFKRIYEQFCAWQDHPGTYSAANERWYRALAMEVGIDLASGIPDAS